LLSLRTSNFFREHGRKPEKLFLLSIETEAVGMAAFTDVSMEITVFRQVIENIGHHFCLDAAKLDLTLIMSVTSEVRDC
jgi:predicted Zn-dependent protease with MMP-like domain